MMSELEYERFVDTVKGMSDEKKQIALRQMPDKMLWDELYNRYEETKASLDGIKNALSQQRGEKENERAIKEVMFYPK